MRILTASQMAACDQATYSKLRIPSRSVMEVAGREVARCVTHYLESADLPVTVVTGAGNNAGDGFIAARLLRMSGYLVDVLAFNEPSTLRDDAAGAAESFIASGGDVTLVSSLGADELSSRLARSALILDALYGTGLNRPLADAAATLVAAINEARSLHGVPVFSVDVPSGVFADVGEVEGEVIQADMCVVLQALKPAHVLLPAADYSGDIVVVDIGVHTSDAKDLEDRTFSLLTEHYVARLVQEEFSLSNASYKNSRGHVVVIGGSSGHVGAAKLSGEAAMRAGAGLVTLGLPRTTALATSSTVLELMVHGLSGDERGAFTAEAETEVAALLQGKQVCVIGPGLGLNESAKQLLVATLLQHQEGEVALVIDADALTILGHSPELRTLLSKRCVLTPHPGEMGRLLGRTTSDVQKARLSAILHGTELYGCHFVLKGARTLISGPGGAVFVNPAATPALGTAGSGDVLSGVLAAVLARGVPPEAACAIGVFAHGCAGELLHAQAGGADGILASDILNAVPHLLNALGTMSIQKAKFEQHILPGSLHQLIDTFEEHFS